MGILARIFIPANPRIKLLVGFIILLMTGYGTTRENLCLLKHYFRFEDEIRYNYKKIKELHLDNNYYNYIYTWQMMFRILIIIRRL